MELLDDLDEVRTLFENQGDQLDMLNFVYVMMKYIQNCRKLETMMPEEQIQLITSLCNFFISVDINDDKLLSWSEFTNEILFIGFRTRVAPEFFKVRLEDKTPKTTVMTRLFYRTGDDFILHSNDTKEVDVVCARTLKLLTRLKFSARVLCFDRTENRLYVALHNRSIQVRSLASKDFGKVLVSKLFQVDVISSIKVIQYSSNLQINGWDSFVLVSSGRNLKPFTMELEAISNELRQRIHGIFICHKSEILAIEVASDLNFVCTSDIDGNIVVFDVVLGYERFRFKQDRSCFQLSYNSKDKTLITANYEHSVYLWDMYSGERICVLGPHSGVVIGVAVIQDHDVVLTATQRTVKIWDSKVNYQCTQTVTLGTPITVFSALYPEHGFVCGREKLRVYDTSQQVISNQKDCFEYWSSAQSDPCIGANLVTQQGALITVHQTVLKKWCLITGSLISHPAMDADHFRRVVQEKLGKSNINNLYFTASSTDPQGKVVMIGTTTGHVLIFSSHNGKLIDIITMTARSCTSTGPVSIITMTDNWILIGMRTKRLFLVEKQNAWDELGKAKKMLLVTHIDRLDKEDDFGILTAIALDPRLENNGGFVLAGSSKGIIRCFSSITANFQCQLVRHTTAIKFLKFQIRDTEKTAATTVRFQEKDSRSIMHSFVSVDVQGNLCIWIKNKWGWDIESRYELGLHISPREPLKARKFSFDNLMGLNKRYSIEFGDAKWTQMRQRMRSIAKKSYATQIDNALLENSHVTFCAVYEKIWVLAAKSKEAGKQHSAISIYFETPKENVYEQISVFTCSENEHATSINFIVDEDNMDSELELDVMKGDRYYWSWFLKKRVPHIVVSFPTSTKIINIAGKVLGHIRISKAQPEPPIVWKPFLDTSNRLRRERTRAIEIKKQIDQIFKTEKAGELSRKCDLNADTRKNNKASLSFQFITSPVDTREEDCDSNKNTHTN